MSNSEYVRTKNVMKIWEYVSMLQVMPKCDPKPFMKKKKSRGGHKRQGILLGTTVGIQS